MVAPLQGRHCEIVTARIATIGPENAGAGMR
jgi:hypothetical protein